jgi:hypothetical protein
MIALKETHFLLLKLGSIGFLLMIASINSYAHDVERIKKLEQDIQELRTRLNNLEVNKAGSGNAQKPIKSSDGWQSLANWRQLQTGMSPSQIREILGEPQRINGGDVATWTYLDNKRMGWVMFVGMRLHSWDEPR